MENDPTVCLAVHPQDDAPQKTRVRIHPKELEQPLIKTLGISLCLCSLFREIGLVVMLTAFLIFVTHIWKGN